MTPSAKFVLKDLHDNGNQTSCDPWADLRFANGMGRLQEARDLGTLMIDSSITIAETYEEYRNSFKKLKKARLNALRELVALDVVSTAWTGVTATHISGLKRIKVYFLNGG